MADESFRGVGVKQLKSFLADHKTYSVYDYSQLEQWDQCAAKWKYKYLDHLVFPPSAVAMFSTHVIHPMVADLFKHGAETASRNASNSQYIKKLYGEYSKRVASINKTNVNWMNRNEVGALTQSTAQYVLAQLVSVMAGIELEFQYTNHEEIYWKTIPPLEAVWLAKPDVMIARKTDGKPVSVEVKLSFWPINANLLAFDRQILSQAWVTDAVEQLKVHIHLDVNSTQQLRDVHITQSRKPPDTNLLKEWHEEMVYSVGVLRGAKEFGVFPKRSPRSCNDFNKPCPMINMCSLGDTRKYLLETLDKENPYDYLGL